LVWLNISRVLYKKTNFKWGCMDISRPEVVIYTTLKTPITPLLYTMGSNILKVLFNYATCPQ